MISTNTNRAAELLCNESIVAIPTETVYGLAGNIYSETAIRSIYELKKRPLNNPLIVHIGHRNQLRELTDEIPVLAEKLIDKFWPGPLTLILKKKNSVPYFVTGNKDTVAIRMPQHPTSLELLNMLPFPLAAPSANPFGSISPTSALHVANYFPNEISMILDGGICKKGMESTIIGFENKVPVLYRLGAIALEDIEKVIGPLVISNFENNNPLAPGMMAKHYAPKTMIKTTYNLQETVDHYNNKKIGLLLFETNKGFDSIPHQEVLSTSGNLAEAASNLYAAMHRLDALNLDIIIAEKFPDTNLGKTINDRLKRATANTNSNKS